MNGNIELEAFNRISKMLEFLLDKFEFPTEIRNYIIGKLWENKMLCLEIDEEVRNIWLKSLK